MKVKFCFDAQFVGHDEVVLDLPDNTRLSDIVSMFPGVLGLKFDDNCWFVVYTDIVDCQ